MNARNIRRNGSGRKVLVAAALGLWAAIGTGGCRAAPLRTATVPYYFTIDFQGGPCPKSADASVKKCPVPPGQNAPPPGCLHIPRGEAVKVQFVSKNPEGKEFVLQFDPFGKTTIYSSDDLTTLPPKSGPKTYTFIVKGTDSACDKVDPVDPQIILN